VFLKGQTRGTSDDFGLALRKFLYGLFAIGEAISEKFQNISIVPAVFDSILGPQRRIVTPELIDAIDR
jgi:hypothetical protein